MDAMRIKRLKRRFSDASMSKYFLEARVLASTISRARYRGTDEQAYSDFVETGRTVLWCLNEVFRFSQGDQGSFVGPNSIKAIFTAYADAKRNIKYGIKDIKDSKSETPEIKVKYLKELNKLYQLITEAELSSRMTLLYSPKVPLIHHQPM